MHCANCTTNVMGILSRATNNIIWNVLYFYKIAVVWPWDLSIQMSRKKQLPIWRARMKSLKWRHLKITRKTIFLNKHHEIIYALITSKNQLNVKYGQNMRKYALLNYMFLILSGPKKLMVFTVMFYKKNFIRLHFFG